MRATSNRRAPAGGRLHLALSSLAICVLLQLPTPLRAAPTRVAYEVHARTESWMPIRLADLSHALAGEVLAALGRSGRLRLEAMPPADSGKRRAAPGADMQLSIDGEVVEQAGNFTVSLTLRPLIDPSRPSFVTAGTVSISRRDKPTIFRLMRAAARQAAERLNQALDSARAQPSGGAASWLKPAQLVSWGKLAPRPTGKPGPDLRRITRRDLSWHQRKEAFFRVAPRAFDETAVRGALARVALTDPDPLARLYAVRMLGPASRKHPYVQHVVLAVLREEADPKVKGEALEQSLHFMGLSPRETLQSWVQLLGAPVAELEPRAFRSVVQQLSYRLQTPNLDLGLGACLAQQQALQQGQQRKRRCLDLVQQLPAPRRTALLLRYLRQPLEQLADDQARRGHSGPLGRAVKLLAQDRCQVSRVTRTLERLLQQSRALPSSTMLLAALGSIQLTGQVVQRAAALLDGAPRGNERRALLRLLTSGYRDPPWAVLAWPELGAVLPRLREQLDGSTGRAVGRAMSKLAQLRKEPHIRALDKHLRPGAPPAASLVDTLTTCVARPGDAERQADCASALQWLARAYPQHRRQAVAASQGLLRAADRLELPRRVRSRLARVISRVRSDYRRRSKEERWEPCLHR